MHISPVKNSGSASIQQAVSNFELLWTVRNGEAECVIWSIYPMYKLQGESQINFALALNEMVARNENGSQSNC